jgi:hypothetical protein
VTPDGNLSDWEVRKRLAKGYGSFLAAFALVGMNQGKLPPHLAQWAPAVPFFLGYINLMQAKKRTCVTLAVTDRDMLDGKLGPVKDRETGWRLKKRAFKMIVGAGLLAAVSATVCRKRQKP